VRLDLILNGFEIETGSCKFLSLGTSLYEAEINNDLILSFSWLSEFELDMKANRYGLQTSGEPSYFIPGTVQPKMGRANEVNVRLLHELGEDKVEQGGVRKNFWGAKK